MTNLEITLIIVIWISYGIFSAFQTISVDNLNSHDEAEVRGSVLLLFLSVCFAPVFFVAKCIYGAFKKYDN